MGNMFSKHEGKKHTPKKETDTSDPIYNVEISSIFAERGDSLEKLEEYQSLIFTPISSAIPIIYSKLEDNLDVTEKTPLLYGYSSDKSLSSVNFNISI